MLDVRRTIWTIARVARGRAELEREVRFGAVCGCECQRKNLPLKTPARRFWAATPGGQEKQIKYAMNITPRRVIQAGNAREVKTFFLPRFPEATSVPRKSDPNR